MDSKLELMQAELGCSRTFWRLFSDLPGCDGAGIVQHGAEPKQSAAAVAHGAPKTSRSKRKQRTADTSPDQRARRNAFFYNNDGTEDDEDFPDLPADAEYTPDDDDPSSPVPVQASEADPAGPSKRIVVHTGKPKAQRVSLKKSQHMAKVKAGTSGQGVSAQDVAEYGNKRMVCPLCYYRHGTYFHTVCLKDLFHN